MTFLKPRAGKFQKLFPGRAKSLIKMQAKSKLPVNREQDSLLRCNELANHARRGFHNDGPGGNYKGF